MVSQEQAEKFGHTMVEVLLQMMASKNWMLTLANKFLAVYQLGIEEGKRRATEGK
jgi:hypothetical protein